ncbi:MAG TPA: hypothetical protein VHX86_12940 [Tepidisphaeraceae bacterium]|nr:hypothetical protein [Tepidisphaeraceae bacterium]
MLCTSRRILAAMAIVWGLLAIPGHLIADDAPQPSRWPMHITASDGADVTIFQPQLESFQGDTLDGRAAVAVVAQNQEVPVFGAVWLQSRVETDRVARTVHIVDVKVTKVLFPNANPVSAQPLSDAVRQAMLAQPIVISLDHLLASVEALNKEQSAAADLQTTPPAIVFRDHPAVLVQYDGTPKMVQASDSGIMRVVNSPFFVALDPSSKTYYLKGAGHWFSAPDPVGPFQNTTQVPQTISQLADQIGYADPQQAVSDDVASRLEIVTATSPTELIWTDGQPQMSTIPGTGLLYWANTDSDVFLQIGTQQMFVLLSGRWFTAPNQSGPWSYVAPNQLPSDFAKIPPGSPKANVLAQVAGTQAAQDAVADTYIPQTAEVDVNNFQQPTVTYDGNPEFEPIAGTGCSYGVNTDESVLLTDGTYYCCSDGVWYQCGNPAGPWGLCRHVPPAIYTIPPSCPDYPVRFCYVYGSTDQSVYVGYTPGYVGCYPFDGTVVYGTGYHYNSWNHNHYYPRPATFGFAARYHAYTGHWGFSFGVAAGGGDAWVAGGAHAHPTAWFGYGGYRPSMAHAGEKINQSIVQANNINAKSAHDRDVYVRNVYERRNDVHVEAAPAETPHAPAQQANSRLPAAREDLRSNNVYVNPQGDVYRRTDSGWEKREGNQWKADQTQHEQHGQAEPTHTEQRAQPAPQERRAASPDRGAPERDYQVRQQSENRSRQASPQPSAPSREQGRKR